MAPDPRKSSADEDFILTLSDDESPAFDLDGAVDGNDDATTDPVKSKVSGTKRRRDDDENVDSGKNTKSKKQKKQKGGKKAVVKVQNVVQSDDEDDGGNEDGVLDPDFEFDIGGSGKNGLLEDFDGWGEKERTNESNPVKKGVDLDEILARRRQKQLEKKEREKRKSAPAEEEQVSEEVVELDDDELLAPDAFGMGVSNDSDENVEDASDESDEDVEMNKGGSDAEQDSEEEQEDEDEDQDDREASPVPHPDDLRLEADSDNDSEEDPEEIKKRDAFFAPEEKSTEDSSSSASFQSFNLSRPILRGLAAVGFSTPTPIQRKTIPFGLLGKDVVGGAVTGSGKTAAFVIPILERLLYRPRKVPTSRVAILMPTRELAVQCYNVATKLGTFTDITFCQLVGGFSLREQENVLKKRPDVIIATPGRFIDHMRNSASFTVDTLEILVLDEADRMLEDGFADELNEILTSIPKSRQTMLFSATMTNTVDKLIRVGLNRPVRLMVDAKKQTVGTLVQEFVRLRPGREDKRLGYLLLLCSTEYKDRVIVFFRQKKEAHRARVVFGLMGLNAAELHGSMSQEQRIKSVESFRDGRSSFLLATDLASRGLDIKGVEAVINYEAPQSHEIYLHRVGRTARAGRAGRACTIAAEPDRKVVKAAVKMGRSQGAKIVSRVIDPVLGDEWATKVADLETEVTAVLREEKEEKQFAQAEMQVTRGENLIRYEDEIKSRPKRTWFETEREKKDAKNRGLTQLNGESPAMKKEKKKLSGKDKKKLDDTRLREEGKMWKKGKTERETKPTKGKGGKGNSVKGKGKPKGKKS